MEPNKDDFSDEMPANDDDANSEFVESLREWWKERFTKQFVTMINPEVHFQAQQAIKKIISITKEQCDKDTMPAFSVAYSRITGTKLSVDIIITEYGLDFYSEQVKEVFALIPPDATISIIPMLHERTRISITFHNVREFVE